MAWYLQLGTKPLPEPMSRADPGFEVRGGANWLENLKPGGGYIAHFKNTIIMIYIYIHIWSTIRYISNTLLNTLIQYSLSTLLTKYYNKKIIFGKFLGGGARPVRPPLNPPLNIDQVLWCHMAWVDTMRPGQNDQNFTSFFFNKANLRDLIAATGLVILLKFDPNHQFFSPCDLEIWCMTSKNNRAPLLYYIKLCVSFQIHRWIQTEVTLWKRSIRVEFGDILSLVTLKFDGWPWKTIWHLFYTTSSFVYHFKSISEFKLELQSRNAQFGSKSAIFCPVWPWNLTDDLEKQ